MCGEDVIDHAGDYTCATTAACATIRPWPRSSCSGSTRYRAQPISNHTVKLEQTDYQLSVPAAISAGGLTGSQTVNVVPLPTVLSTSIRPQCFCTMP